MKTQLLFVGNKFIYNNALQDYVIRQVRQKVDYPSSIHYFKENDNSLFLHLEKELNSSLKILIVTTKQNFSTIGKLVSTVTSDNQILKDGMLIPQKSSVFEPGSYLLEHKNCLVNILHVDEMQKLPEILLEEKDSNAIVHLFEEDRDGALLLLSPISQMYDVSVEAITIIDGWLQLNIKSKKYGNISNFISSAKQLLGNKLISSSNIVNYIIEVLSKNQKKITFAESCTGGLLSYYFTKNNGASKILEGSLITYSNHLKENWLAVDNKTLEAHGAVSDEVVLEMSEGAMNVSDADYAISISGIAGDTGGTPTKPVGTVHIGVRTKQTHHEIKLYLQGDRNYVQHQSALYAIKLLLLIDKKMFF